MFPPSKRLAVGSIPTRRAREIKAPEESEAFCYVNGSVYLVFIAEKRDKRKQKIQGDLTYTLPSVRFSSLRLVIKARMFICCYIIKLLVAESGINSSEKSIIGQYSFRS